MPLYLEIWVEKLDIFKSVRGSSLYQENVTQGPNMELNSTQEKAGTPAQCRAPTEGELQ